jgi:hypothetical protein
MRPKLQRGLEVDQSANSVGPLTEPIRAIAKRRPKPQDDLMTQGKSEESLGKKKGSYARGVVRPS